MDRQRSVPVPATAPAGPSARVVSQPAKSAPLASAHVPLPQTTGAVRQVAQATWALSVLCGALALPPGLPRVGAAWATADALELHLSSDAAVAAPLAALWARAFTWLPLGDVASRVGLASLVAAAWAAVAVARLSLAVVRELRPQPHARLGADGFRHEPIAAWAAAGTALLALSAWRALIVAGPAAVTVALVALGLEAAVALVARPDRVDVGFRLSFVVGLSIAAHPLALSVLGPPTFVLWIWALRRGERWPQVAPLVAAAALAIALLLVVCVSPAADAAALTSRLFLGPLRHALAEVTAPDVGAVLSGVGGDLGVVALLVGAVGLAVLVVRAPATVALLVYAGWAVTVTAGVNAGSDDAASASLSFLAAAPIAAGIAHVATKLGSARPFAAAVVAVLVLVPAALDGGLPRWRPDVRMPARLLERAHDQAPVGAAVDPGSAEMAALFRYGQAVGLRPDLRVRAASADTGRRPRQR